MRIVWNQVLLIIWNQFCGLFEISFADSLELSLRIVCELRIICSIIFHYWIMVGLFGISLRIVWNQFADSLVSRIRFADSLESVLRIVWNPRADSSLESVCGLRIVLIRGG